MATFHRIFLSLFALAACQPEQPSPVIDEVRPNWGYNAEDTEISIYGDGFFAGVGASDGSVERYDRDFVVALTGTQGEERLESVTQVSESELVAVVPAGRLSGWYGIRVITPGQDEATLPDAYEVTATKADRLSVEASSTSLSVAGLSIVRLKVLNPDGAVVRERFPVTVRLTPTRTTGSGFTLDPGNLVDVDLDTTGRSLSGQTGPTGEAFVIVSSTDPDEMVVEAEVSIRDRATISGQELVDFKAGGVARVEVGLPPELTETSAGEMFEVILSLVDDGGNRVSGQTATVAITEECEGGGLSEFVTFVDSARVTVGPTQACEENSVVAFGVVEGGSVSGQSAPFTVRAGEQAKLGVLATPEVLQAGVDDVVLFIRGEDAWGNPTPSPIGDLTLHDEYGLVSESNGNGTFTCESAIAGTAQCVARLYRAAEARTIRVESDEGREGVANPVQVMPGPGDRVSVDIEGSEFVAGESFTVQISVEDAFSNRLILGSTDLASVVFSDDFGPADCPLAASDMAARRYEFECVVTVAGDGNALHVQVPTEGVIGHSDLFDVAPGNLSAVTLTVDESLVSAGGDVGVSVPLAAEGLDAYGNRVTGTWTVGLRNVAGGMDVDGLELVDGVAFQWVVFTRAARGDSIWAMDGENILGGSVAFDVRAGDVADVIAVPASPWGFVGRPFDVELALVDDFGNPVSHGGLPFEIDPIGGLGPRVEGVLSGESVVSLVFEEAGLGENLWVQVGDYSTEITGLDVALDCGDDARVMEPIGVTDGRVCLGGDTMVSVTWDATGLVHANVARDGGPLARGDLSRVDVPIGDRGVTVLDGLFVGDDACGEEGHLVLYAGPSGETVGPVSLVSAAEVLVAGTDGGLGSADILVGASECSGDPAAHGEVFVRTDMGALSDESGGPLRSTGEGLQVVLNDVGEAMVTVSMVDAVGSGTAHVVAGSAEGASLGVVSVDVTGDLVPPRVIDVSPSGTTSGWVSEIQVTFSERMLWVEDLLPAGMYFDITSASGEPLDIASAAWLEGEEVLVLTLAESIEMSTEALNIALFDTLRDAAGNRLDGDLDGEASGDWVGTAGAVPDEAPDVTLCSLSSGWFRPDGDDGEGLNADHVWLFMEAEGPSEWWQIDVVDTHGLVARHTKPRSRPIDGSFVFDGRDQAGRVLEEGMVVLRVRAMDTHGNLGSECRAAVQIEQVVSAR